MINLIVNGNSYSYPQPGDKANTGWGSQGTNWASAVTAALTSLGLGGTLTPTPNTVIDINSTTKGILIPRLTTTQRNAITSPATSLLIFNTTLGVFQYYTGSAWITIGAKIPDNVQFDGTLLVNGNINTNGAVSGASLNSTGNALIGNGLVSAPAYSFTNDSNSGLYRISEDKIGFAANGVRQGEFGVGYGGFTGNVIQHVVSSYSTQVTATTSTYKSVGFSCSITPKYANSKILIIYMIGGVYGSSSGGASFKLYKNGSELSGSYEDMHVYSADTGGTFLRIASKYTGFYLDSPGVTTSTSYELYFNARNNTGTTYVQYTSSNSIMICLEIQQ